jgi:membrane-associated phospholipid phosphatase
MRTSGRDRSLDRGRGGRRRRRPPDCARRNRTDCDRKPAVNDRTADLATPRGLLRRAAEEARALDLAVYSVITTTSTPVLDGALARLTTAADHSRLSIGSATALAFLGGRTGRAAATRGLASVAVTSAVVNVGIKSVARRRRPDRLASATLQSHPVQMPASSSFPSGHSAAAFAFATGVASVLPVAALPLRSLAALVAYSRVHTGVHYPGDVVAGAVLGTALAQATTYVLDQRGRP